MAEVTMEQLEQKYAILVAKRNELVEAVNRVDGALEAVNTLWEEINGTDEERSESSREVQGSDQEPDSEEEGAK